MQRLVALLAVSVASLAGLSLQANAADYNLRGTLPGWGFENDTDPVGFEAGLRYWFSLGTQAVEFNGDTFDSSDTSQIVEKYLRIDDYSTDTYIKTYAGFAPVISGTYSTPEESGSLTDGHVYYYVGDFGWTPFTFGEGGDGNGIGVGGLLGYMYWNDSPSTGYTNFLEPDTVSWTTAGPDPVFNVDSDTQNLTIHALRLGKTANGTLGPFAITAEAAAIPYAWINGTLGADTDIIGDPCVINPDPTCELYRSSATTIDGHGFGATAEIMAGMNVLNDWNLRFGARAWYLMGVGKATITTAEITDASESDPIGNPGVYDVPGTLTVQNWFYQTDVFSITRVGLLAELSKSF